MDHSVTNHLIRTDEDWIAARTWSEPGGSTGLTVTNHGECLGFDVLELSCDCITDRLRNEALDAIDSHEAVERPVEPFTALVRYATEVTQHLVTEWETGADHVVRERVHEGVGGWTGRTAWTAHKDGAIYFGAERATTQFINEHVNCEVGDDVEAIMEDINKESVDDAIAKHRGRRTPHLDYAAEVTLTD